MSQFRSPQENRPSVWAISLLMLSIVAMVAAVGLLGADIGWL